MGPRFANEQQRAFFDSRAPELLYSGAFGAGKSRILCEKAYALGQRYPGAPIGIFRKVRASLAATTARTFFRDVVPAGAIVRKNVTEGWYELANGSRFWLLGLDADPVTGVPSKVGSLDLAFAFVDEAVEVQETDWLMIAGRLRWPDVPFHQIAGATNPTFPDHWLRKRFDPSTEKRQYLHAATHDNRFLPKDYLERLDDFIGVSRERFVLGAWVNAAGVLFNADWIRRDEPPKLYQNGVLDYALRRIVVAVDPAVTADKHSDETGIVIAGVDSAGTAYVLDDRSGRYTPKQWADIVAAAYHEYKADTVVAEVNNGGDLVTMNLHSADTNLPVRTVTASRGKIVRAEPVAKLYQDGKVNHVKPLHQLESQMVSYDGGATQKSPDRLDALVWALTDLMLLSPVGSTDKAWIA